MSTGNPVGQFLRFAQLVVSKGYQGIDLSQMRFSFEVRASDVETPNTAAIRVYNLKDDTRNAILGPKGAIPTGDDTVTLTCGYQNGNKGTIFQGNIKRFNYGKERNVDSYLEILAADGDQPYNNALQNQAFPKGTNDQQTLSSLAGTLGIPVSPAANNLVSTGGIVLPRGKVQFGMARLFMKDLAKNKDARWSIQNGTIELVPNQGYLEGEAVQLNSASGMLGTPEQTDNGIIVRCYLNPLIRIGQAIQINNGDINQSQTYSQTFYPTYTSQYYPATTTNDGFYRVLVAEHFGDLRSNDFFTELTCLSIDKSSPVSTSVLPQG
jgi:hypothetical protein